MKLTEREPDFENIKALLSHKKPARPTLFEFYMNSNVYQAAAGPAPTSNDPVEQLAYVVRAYAACGYDYANTLGCDLHFLPDERHGKATLSLNEHSYIKTWDDFYNYPWPDTEHADYSRLSKIREYLPPKMKLMISGPDGLLENVISIVGYDNLCLMLYDEPELVEAIFNKVGEILLTYYKKCMAYDTVGMLMGNDDWGFNTQTMISPNDLRKYVFPWHKKFVEAAHDAGKFAVLHSCGYMMDIMDDIIYDMKYDGRHSYEDKIVPVEKAYELWGDKIAILGGIDVDFLVRSSEEDIRKRAENLLEMSKDKGGYALGSGNSIPEYISNEHYFAMIQCAL